MIELITYAGTVFMSLFAIMNPIANSGVFVGLTSNKDKAFQKRAAIKSLVIAFIMVATFVFLGTFILKLFGISMLAFKMTGGAIIAIVGYQMMNGKTASIHDHGGGGDVDIAVSPLAVPILAGPGTIVTAMSFSSTPSHEFNSIIVICAFAILCVITYGFFMAAEKMVGVIGKDGVTIITRIMGLILCVIGAQMLIDGSQSIF